LLGYLLRIPSEDPLLIFVLYIHSNHEYYSCSQVGENSDEKFYDSARKLIMDQKREITGNESAGGETCRDKLFLLDGRLLKAFVEAGTHSCRSSREYRGLIARIRRLLRLTAPA